MNSTAASQPPGCEPNGWMLRPWHGWLLLAGLALRLGFCLTVDREAAFGGWDGKEYHAYAQRLLHFQGDDYPRFFNCLRAPGYPLFLTPFVALTTHYIWPIQLAQSLLGILQVWLLASLAGRWAGRRAGDWALVLAVFNPFLIYFPAFVLTETLFITLLWVGMHCLLRVAQSPAYAPRWVAGGAIALGLGCLTRPALQPFLVVAVLWLGLVIVRRAGVRPSLLLMAWFTAVTSALLLPWMIGNKLRHGEFTLAPRGASLVYAQSNSPDYLRTYEARTKAEYYQALTRLHLRFAVDGGEPPETWVASARRFQEEQRTDWLRLQGHKVRHFWTPWLNPLIVSRAVFLASLLAATPIFLLAVMEVWRRLRRQDAFLWLLLGLVAVGFLVGGLLFHVQVRYRIPFVDLSFLVLSASWLGNITRRKPRSSSQQPTAAPARVLWISCVGEKGGAEVYMLNLLRHLDRRQFTPAVALLRPGSLENDLRELGVAVHLLPAHRMRNLAAVVRAIWTLRQLIRQREIDLIHSNGFRAHVYGGLAAWLAGVPEVWTVHTVEKHGLFMRAVFQIPTAHVLANCPRTADFFIAHGCPVSLIWPSVDTGQLAQAASRSELAARYGVPPAARWVCMGARMQRYKGHEFFLRALAALPAGFEDVQGVIMGGSLFGQEPAYENEMKALASQLGISSRVRFTGFIADADLFGFVSGSELVVHAALDEDFGLIVAEAQALGKPVLAFASVGPAVILAPEETGRLVPVGDQKKLNLALVDLLAAPERLRRWGEAGRARSGRLFAAEQAAGQLERIYAACLPADPRCKV